VLSRGVSRRLELSVSRQGKSVRVDGKEVRTPSEFFGCLHPVLFSPEEVMLIKGPPAGRRSLIDRALFQADVTYLDRAREFDRCLRQRNRLLRDQAAEREIEPWTEALIRSGARLRRERLHYLERLQPLMEEAFRQISGGEEAKIQYLPAGDLPALEKVLAEEMAAVAGRERRLGQTLAGPHRDDPVFSVDGKPLRSYGSQGQQRSFLLAFKTAQVRDLEGLTGEAPPLLLDDLTSELDPNRRDFFFRFLLERQGQVFITTTEIGPLLARGLTAARFFRVEQGALRHDSRQRG
jgi:DNA replication and repair protein RecF